MLEGKQREKVETYLLMNLLVQVTHEPSIIIMQAAHHRLEDFESE